jgi:uncharacterized protein (DUF1697 family)
MPRYVALLRGASPANCPMPELADAFRSAGFSDVRTVLSSGNVAFTTRASSGPALERRAEAAMRDAMGRSFPTIVRASAHLQALVAGDPFAGFTLPPTAKRVVTFLRQPPDRPAPLPIEQDGVRILRLEGAEVLTAYVPGPKGPVFMALLERTFGREITTRTLDTVRKCAVA